MLFTCKANERIKVLAIGSHPDDIEIGAGGFLSRLQKEYDAEVHFGIMTYGTSLELPTEKRIKEARAAAQILLGYTENMLNKQIHLGLKKDCELHKDIHELIRIIETWLKTIRPNILLTHAKGDLHDDHRQVNKATLSAARDFHGDILTYQAPSTIPNEFSPNFFVELTDEEFTRKINAINCHSTQKGKWFMEQGFYEGMCNTWAMLHRLPTKKLEAFGIYQAFLSS